MRTQAARLRDLITMPFRAGVERGATAVEYALMIAGIAVVIAAIVIAVGAQTGAIFTDISTRFP